MATFAEFKFVAFDFDKTKTLEGVSIKYLDVLMKLKIQTMFIARTFFLSVKVTKEAVQNKDSISWRALQLVAHDYGKLDQIL